MIWIYAVVYFIIISVIAIILTVYDKIISYRSHIRRISEQTLIFIAVFGGAGAMYVTMLAIRHKTRHGKFMFGLPVITALHIALIVAVYHFLI